MRTLVPKLLALGLALTAFFALGARPALAWGATGHMITAQIAYQELTPEARQEADRLIALLAGFEPRTDHVVTASLWMDELRGGGMRAMDTWHYINIPYNAGGLPSVPPAKSVNVIWAIGQAERTLADPEASDFSRAFMLRVLLHLTGDIHQPLHTVGRCTREHPNGDRGGNDFEILDPDGEPSNLHRYWDNTADLFPWVPSGEWRQRIPTLAAQLTGQLPKSALPEWTQSDPGAWARESFRLAVATVYTDIEEGAMPTAAYTSRARRVIATRLVLGGYRLGAQLNRLLGAPPAEAPNH